VLYERLLWANATVLKTAKSMNKRESFDINNLTSAAGRFSHSRLSALRPPGKIPAVAFSDKVRTNDVRLVGRRAASGGAPVIGNY
jgi:hypothetical protein